MLYEEWFDSFWESLIEFFSVNSIFSLFDVQIDSGKNGATVQKYAFAKDGADAVVKPFGENHDENILVENPEAISREKKKELYEAALENRLFINTGLGLGLGDGEKQLIKVDDANQCVITAPEPVKPTQNISEQKSVPEQKITSEQKIVSEQKITTEQKTASKQGAELKQDTELKQSDDEKNMLSAIINAEPRPEKALGVPDNLKTGGSLADLEQFRKNAGNLSADDKAYVDARIATEKFYADFFRKKNGTAAKPAVRKTDGTIILDHIHQDQFQTTYNGCYSCAYQLLLQSRGLNLTQQQIRAYKGDWSDHQANERSLGDRMGNIVSLGGIVAAGIPNTAVKEQTFRNLPGASQDEKMAVYAAMKKTIIESLTKHSSPVALLRGVHYTTIVGYNENTDTLTFKNSYGFNLPKGSDPNMPHTMKLSDLLSAERLTLTHLVNINPADPCEGLDGVDGLEFVKGRGCENGEFMKGDGRTMGYQDCKDTGVDGIVATDKQFPIPGKKVYIQTSYMLPQKLDLTPQMQNTVDEKFRVKKLSDDPFKQALMAEIKARKGAMEQLPVQITANMAAVSEAQLGLAYAKYAQVPAAEEELQKRKQNLTTEERDALDRIRTYMYFRRLENKIDELTPAQVRDALSEKTIRAWCDNLAEEISLCKAFSRSRGYTLNPQQIWETEQGYENWEVRKRDLKELLPLGLVDPVTTVNEFTAQMRKTGPGSYTDAVILEEMTAYLVKEKKLPEAYAQPVPVQSVSVPPVPVQQVSVSPESEQKSEPAEKKDVSGPKNDFVSSIGILVGDLEKIGDISATEGQEYKIAYEGVRDVYRTLLESSNEDLTAEYIMYAMKAINSAKRGYERTHSQLEKLNETQKNILKIFSGFDQFARFVSKQMRSSGLSSPEESENSVKAPEPVKEKAFPSPAEVLGQEKMSEYMAAMNSAPDFINSKIIPDKLKTGGTIEELEAFKEANRKKLSKDELKYLDGRIAAEQFYDHLSKNPSMPVLQEPEVNEGVILLKHIHQKEYQSTGNGCYSAAMALLLQSRGMNLTQQQVRAFRGDSDVQSERILGDRRGNAGCLGGIAAAGLINTGMVERTYPLDFSRAPESQKKAALDDMKKHILNALLVYKSPVALLKNSHYLTVVGYDVRTDKLLVKNSWPGLKKNVDKTYEMPLSDLGKANNINLGYLVDIKPEKPLEAIDGIRHQQSLEIIGDGISFTKPPQMGAPDLQHGKKWRAINDDADISRGDFFTGVLTSLPEKLYIPDSMKPATAERKKQEETVQTRKAELLKQIEAKQNELFPANTAVTVNGSSTEIQKHDYSNVQFDCYRNREDGTKEKVERTVGDFKTFYYLDVLKSKINILTAKQTELAMDEKWMEESIGQLTNVPPFRNFMRDNLGRPMNPRDMSSLIMADQFIVDNRPKLKAMGQEELMRCMQDYFKGKKKESLSPGDKRIGEMFSKLLSKFSISKDNVNILPEEKKNVKNMESPVVSHP